MAGQKLFVNEMDNTLSVVLFVRQSDNPANNAGQVSFTLNGKQSEQKSYGDNVNIYLNGISIVEYSGSSVISQQDFVIQRGSTLDNELNMNNTVVFSNPSGASISISCQNN